MTAPTPPTTAALVARYAGEASTALLGGRHGVASPLGAWLLLAVVAGAAHGEAERDRFTELLGTHVDEAGRRAAELLDRPHAAVSAAAALWSRPELLVDGFAEWAATVASAVEQGPMPTQSGADRWAFDHTQGLIDRFPLQLDGLSALVAATALATRVSWDEPFGLQPAEPLGAPWSGLVQQALWASPLHERFVAATAAAGDVAVHAASAREGLRVVSVVAAAEVEPAAVLAAAHEVAALLAGHESPAVRRSLFDLPVGAGHSWTIEELTQQVLEGEPDRIERVRSLLMPAWSARSDHDLLAADLGFAEVATAVGRFLRPDMGPPSFEARQAAVAAFTRVGFEAAAVTAFGMRAASAPRATHPATVRLADIAFGRPYAVVATAVDDSSSPWDGVPVFAAWVADPTEAAGT